MAEAFATKPLGVSTGLPTTVTTIYTVPAATKTVLTTAVVCNTTSARRNFALLCVTWFMPGMWLEPYETFIFRPNTVLVTTETVQAYADVAGAIHLHLSGVEITATGPAETFTTTHLAAAALSTTATTALYTVPSATRAVVTSLVIANASSGLVHVSLQTTTTGVSILKNVPVPSFETHLLEPNIVLAAADGLSVNIDTAVSVHVRVSGVEIT